MASEEFKRVQQSWLENAIHNEKYCDAIFVVGKERAKLFGFRGLLANISPVFEAQFFGSFREAVNIRDEIEYPTISPNVFACIIRASLNLDPNINAENVMELIQVSQMLQIPQLQKECSRYLENNLSVDNVLFVLNAGYCLNSLNKKFYKKSLRIALKNATSMISNKGFYSLHPKLLIQFLASNCFKVKEEHLWHACVKWAQNVVDNELTFKYDHQPSEHNDALNHNYAVWQKSLQSSKDQLSLRQQQQQQQQQPVHGRRRRRRPRAKQKIVKSQTNALSLSNDEAHDDDDEDHKAEIINFDEHDDDDDDDDGEEDGDHEEAEEEEDEDEDKTQEDEDEDEDGDDEKSESVIHLTPRERQLYRVLQPVIPYLRYALMDKQFFIDHVAKYLTPRQRDAVYIHYILPQRATLLFNDSERHEYSNKRFSVVASNVRLDKAKMLSQVDDWWSHTNFATESPQWFVVKLPDPCYISVVQWKNRWGDGETAKDVQLQVSKQSNAYSVAAHEWTTFWTFRSEKTSNWLTFQVPQNEEVPPSMYWRFVIISLYGDNSCRCGLDQIKITCTL